MNKKIVLTILLLFLSGCQGWPSHARLAQFKDSPASTLIFSNEAFLNATGESPWYIYWTNKDYLTVNGTKIENPSSLFAIKISDLSIISRPEDMYTFDSKISPDGKYFISFPEGDNWGVSSLTDLIEAGNSTLVYSFPTHEYGLGTFEWSRDSQNIAQITVDGLKNSIALRIYNLPSHSVRTVFEYVENIKGTRMENMVGDNLSWSADGKRLAFSVHYETDVDTNRPNIQHDLFIYNIEKNKLVKVTSTPDVSEYYASWYPDNNILMFLTGDGGTDWVSGKLSFLANDGECLRTLPGYEGISSPSWSPDGKQIAYISTDGIEFLDVEKIIPPEYLSPDTLCKISDDTGE